MIKYRLLLGALLCLIACMSWGAMFPVAGIALQHMDPYYFSVIRYVSVAVILCIALWMKEGRKAFQLQGKGKHLVFFGAMAFSVYNLLVFAGQDMLGEPGVIIASLGEAMMPMISVLLLWSLRKGRPGKVTMLCMIVSFIGAFLVVTNGNLGFFTQLSSQVLPLMMILIGMLGWVVYTLGGNQFREWSILRFSALTCLYGTLVSVVIVGVATALGWLSMPSIQALVTIRWEMTYMVLIAGIVALLSWNAGIKLLTPINGILFINFVPITTLVIMALQGYSISLFEYAGISLVIYSLIRSNLHQRKQQANQTNDSGEPSKQKLTKPSVSSTPDRVSTLKTPKAKFKQKLGT